MFELSGGANRDNTFAGTITQTDGSAFVLGPSDGLRLRLGRLPSLTLIDLSTAAPTAAGSLLEITNRGDAAAVPPVPAAYRITLKAAETAQLAAGAYDAELLVTTPGTPVLQRPVDDGTLLLKGTLP